MSEAEGRVVRSLRSVLVVRSILTAFLAIVAVVTFVGGDTVFGALFAAMALTNVALIATFRRRAGSSGAAQHPE